MFKCYGCGREEFQEAEEAGFVSGTRPAQRRCCRGVLQNPESATEVRTGMPTAHLLGSGAAAGQGVPPACLSAVNIPPTERG